MWQKIPLNSGSRNELWQAVGLGTTLAVGMAGFSLIGYLIDRKRGGGVLFTLCGMVMGLLYGGYEVWKVVRILSQQDKKEPGKSDLSEPAAKKRTDTGTK
jgi:hypothetical protein